MSSHKLSYAIIIISSCSWNFQCSLNLVFSKSLSKWGIIRVFLRLLPCSCAQKEEEERERGQKYKSGKDKEQKDEKRKRRRQKERLENYEKRGQEKRRKKKWLKRREKRIKKKIWSSRDKLTILEVANIHACYEKSKRQNDALCKNCMNLDKNKKTTYRH